MKTVLSSSAHTIVEQGIEGSLPEFGGDVAHEPTLEPLRVLAERFGNSALSPLREMGVGRGLLGQLLEVTALHRITQQRELSACGIDNGFCHPGIVAISHAWRKEKRMSIGFGMMPLHGRRRGKHRSHIALLAPNVVPRATNPPQRPTGRSDP